MSRPARHVIAIGSGKGGVGKSTVSLNVALALLERDLSVGILDADIYGPNIPLMLNIARTRPAKHVDIAGGKPIEPVEAEGLKVMSSGFIVAEEQPLNWDGGLIRVLVNQLVQQVAWGDLDVLVIDLPPGTGGVQQILLETCPPSGLVMVVTPQDVAHLDARRALEMYQRANVKILGAVENMSGFVCPHCSQRTNVFAPVREDRALWSSGVERLGVVPLDPSVGEGRPVVLSHPDSAQAWALRQVADRIMERL